MLNDNFEKEDKTEDMFLSFSVNQENYAVCIVHVTEIIGVPTITEVPDVPSFIKGVINLRGKVIAVMDVRLRFHMEPRKYDNSTCIIILEADDVPMGLVVDQVNEVVEIPSSQIDLPASWKHTENTIIQGLARQGDDVSIILNARALLFDRNACLNLESFTEKK